MSPDVADANRVQSSDTTLRDGEQSPGISLNTQEKVEIAQQLARLGVDVIEAGFPITSPGDFEAVESIARKVEGPVICGLARTHKADIDAAWGAIKDAERPRIHTFISTSDIHIEHQLQTTRDDVKGQAKAAVTLAKSYCEDVEFSPMDATRAEIEFTAEVCGIAIAEGATVINIPDTVGYTTPEEYRRYFERLHELLPGFTGYAVQPNKAIVGRNAFAHEAGIHQDGVLKERTTYEIMDARDVGLESNLIVLGKHSGRHAQRDALEQLGFKVEGNALNQAFSRFKEIADKKKQITALDLEAIVSEEMRESAERYTLQSFEVTAGSHTDPRAKVVVRVPSGEDAVGESGGDGPVDAIFGAIRAATDEASELRSYTVSAVTEGEDALGEVTVMLRAHGRLASGQGVATDILEASARAYVRALSNALEGAAVREAEEVAAEAASEPATPGP